MRKADLSLLFDYNTWANWQVLAAARGITSEQFSAPAGTSHGSLRGTLVHILGAEIMWRRRCQEGISPKSLLREDEFPTLESLENRWREETDVLQGFIESLKDDDTDRLVSYTNTRGVSYASVVWQALMHVVNHGTQFRSEAAMVLTGLGRSPGDLDLIFFLRERERHD